MINLLIGVDRIVAKFVTVLSKKIYWLTGKNNFWLANLFLAALAIFLVAPFMMIIVNNILIHNYYRSLGILVLEILPVSGIYLMVKNAISVLGKQRHGDDALDLETYSEEQFCKLARMPLLLLFIPIGVVIFLLLSSRIEFSLLIASTTSILIAFFCSGTIFYFITIDVPPGKRAKIKEWLKSIFELPILTPVPMPVPIK